MTAQERLDLIEQLRDSLRPEDVAVTAAQRTELEGRLESLEKDRTEGISWDELKSRLATPGH